MKNNFISILNKKETSKYIKKLHVYLSKHFDTEIICDEKTYSDEYSIEKGFFGLAEYNITGRSTKKTCSWDKSLLNIHEKKLINNYNYFYFIEDDVYCRNLDSFKKLIISLDESNADLLGSYIENKKESEDWPMWSELEKDAFLFKKENLHKSINPMCRLSSKLINKILDFNLRYKRFIFHELLFPSICSENNYIYEDLIDSSRSSFFFGNWQPGIRPRHIKNKQFRNYGWKISEDILFCVSQDNKIYHPVKNTKKYKPIKKFI